MGDLEEVERLQAGIRAWLLRTARSGRHELRGIGAPTVLPLLCAAVFHGRERLIAELAGKVAGTGIVMVTGASGAGKTSLLQAGL